VKTKLAEGRMERGGEGGRGGGGGNERIDRRTGVLACGAGALAAKQASVRPSVRPSTAAVRYQARRSGGVVSWQCPPVGPYILSVTRCQVGLVSACGNKVVTVLGSISASVSLCVCVWPRGCITLRQIVGAAIDRSRHAADVAFIS